MSSTAAPPPGLRSLKARAIGGSFWVLADFGGAQVLRLISNLVLTRLLFPEAFGMMALVQVFIVGLGQFSDTGLNASIVHNKRGDDPDFLNTAWTVQVLRGILLWLMTWALALPAARLYGEPQLAQLLPAAGLMLLFAGFTPTAVHSADRHLTIGRVTMIKLGAQILTLAVMMGLAFWLRSVWALAIGTALGDLFKTIAFWLFLPGARNRVHWERSALGELFHFGKYIFLGTIAAFAIGQGDRAILGLYIPLAALGVYNIGFFLANVPVLLMRALQQKVVFPIQRMRPPAESAGNRAAVFRARRLLTLGMLVLAAILAFSGPALVDLLYDERYAGAGPMVTLYSLTLVPVLCLGVVIPTLLASGDSKRMLVVQAVTAAVQTALLFIGIQAAGVLGAILAPGVAVLLTWPLRIAYARRYGAWDPVQDIGLMVGGLAVCGAACALHWQEILTLLP